MAITACAAWDTSLDLCVPELSPHTPYGEITSLGPPKFGAGCLRPQPSSLLKVEYDGLVNQPAMIGTCAFWLKYPAAGVNFKLELNHSWLPNYINANFTDIPPDLWISIQMYDNTYTRRIRWVNDTPNPSLAGTGWHYFEFNWNWNISDYFSYFQDGVAEGYDSDVGGFGYTRGDSATLQLRESYGNLDTYWDDFTIWDTRNNNVNYAVPTAPSCGCGAGRIFTLGSPLGIQNRLGR